MVGKIGRHAHPTYPSKSLEELQDLVRDLTANIKRRRVPRRADPRTKATRLTDAQVQEILASYCAGTSSKRLAADYHVDIRRLLALLRNHGIEVRRQPPTEEQLARAAELYAEGLSVAAVANKLGLSATTLTNHLRKSGVALRPRGGSRARAI